MLDKNEARIKYKEIRRSVEDRAEKERAILGRLMNEYGDSRSVFCYESFGSEVSTKEIIRQFLERGAQVYVPVVAGDGMLLKNLVSGELLDKQCALTVVPLLAFDGKCNRLGYGKGYYDRYLKRSDTTAVGIAFAEQYCEELPYNEYDTPLSAIILPFRSIINMNN